MTELNLELLKKLSEAVGVSGDEVEIAKIVKDELEGIAEFEKDRLGSIIAKKKGTTENPKIMLAGHMDEVGFMVSKITTDGFIRFLNLGGWWPHTVLAQRVMIRTRNDGDIPGVIGAKAPHYLTPAERSKILPLSKMYVDVGATSQKEARETFGIREGDIIYPLSPFTQLKNEKFLLGKAWDDRIGVAMFIEILKHFVGKEHPNTLYGVGTVQEEVGTRGAGTSSYVVNPDVAFILEGPPADDCFVDVPRKDREASQGALGKGPQIRLYDRTCITNPKLRDLVLDVAEEIKIPYQVAVRSGGGTDAAKTHIHKIGVPSIVIGVPVRNAHSHIGIINSDDYLNSMKLMIALIEKLDKETVDNLTKF